VGGHNTHTYDTKIASMSLQNSSYGLPIPIVYGTNRVAGNLVDYLDFTAVPHTTTTRTGKGGHNTTSNTTYTYTVAATIALCEGPIAGIGRVWSNASKYSLNVLNDSRLNGIFATLGSASHAISNIVVKYGTMGQSPWAYMVSKHAAHALPYSGTANVSSVWGLGDSSAMPNFTWEILGLKVQSATNPDSDPKDIIYDLLTNPVYGVYGPSIIPYLADMTPFSLYCQVRGLYFSPTLTDARAAVDIIKDILDATSCQAVWSQGKLKIIPYCEEIISGNGLIYTPNVTPVYDLSNDHFLDELTCTRTLSADAYNYVEVGFTNRAKDYNSDIGRAMDLASINIHGIRKMPDVTFDFITRNDVAKRVAQLAMQRALFIRNQYKASVSWKQVALDPMDIVTATEPSLGLSKKPIRATKMSFDEDDNIQMEFEECLLGTTTEAIYAVQNSSGMVVDQLASPGSINPPWFFPMPIELTAGQLKIGVAVSGSNPYWGGCNIWISTDNLKYTLVGTAKAAARMGVLYADLPDSSGIDITNKIAVNLTESMGAMLSGTDADFAALATICWVGGELIAYENANLQGVPYEYLLDKLARGVYGTPHALRAAGTQFARLDDAIITYPFKSTDVGTQIWVKCTSFNIFQQAEEDISTVTAYPYTVANPLFSQASGLSAAVNGTQVVLSFTPPTSAAYDHAEIYIRNRDLTWNDAGSQVWNSSSATWNTVDESAWAQGITYSLAGSAFNQLILTLPSGSYHAKVVAVTSSPASVRADFAGAPMITFMV